MHSYKEKYIEIIAWGSDHLVANIVHKARNKAPCGILCQLYLVVK